MACRRKLIRWSLSLRLYVNLSQPSSGTITAELRGAELPTPARACHFMQAATDKDKNTTTKWDKQMTSTASHKHK
jgi:hypothetical protein